MSEQPLFRRIALIGIGLIGSSLARRARRDGLAAEIVCCARTARSREKALELGIVDRAFAAAEESVAGADLVILCTPLSAYGAIVQAIAPALDPGTILSDVGSVKSSAIRDVMPHLPAGVHFVPAHPVAGTEHSGPDAGFAELFDDRWCILTPEDGTDEAAVARVGELWRRVGMNVEIMDAAHHDRVMAITSHLPHLIAYTIVGTATGLAEQTKTEVINLAASGFRDFTRIAASDPVMWRDIFLKNQEAVLEILERFNDDLAGLQEAIRQGDGDRMEALFTRTRAIRRGILDAHQA